MAFRLAQSSAQLIEFGPNRPRSSDSEERSPLPANSSLTLRRPGHGREPYPNPTCTNSTELSRWDLSSSSNMAAL
jgi:hypothetical protein